jgi:Zn-dependent M28 family amino/carboxypeptidase
VVILIFYKFDPLLKKVNITMKKIISLAFVLIILTSSYSYSQKDNTGPASIHASDLESYLTFLASPQLKGRMNGQEGLEIAANYIASQAKKIGLQPVGGSSYKHGYIVINKSLDTEKSGIRITRKDGSSSIIGEPFYQLYPSGVSNFNAEGDIVFAGYGINDPGSKYSDFDSLKLEGKIVLIMDRAPLSSDGKKCLFEDQSWMTRTGMQRKMQFLRTSRAKAVIIVADPKSGNKSYEDSYPAVVSRQRSRLTLKGQETRTPDLPGIPRQIFVHRKVADEILSGTGTTLEDLQNSIDKELKPHSFEIKGVKVEINEVEKIEEKTLPNIAGVIEGSDPVLKNEYVIFSGHMDHIGVSGNQINFGADDNASGCSALLEIAEAFETLPKKPARSILFLWVSGEEIGLYGSESYINDPYVPIAKTVADLNMDMIGRMKSEADTSKNNPMTGPNAVFVVTDYQSKDLISIANDAAKNTGLRLDFSLSGRNHPLQLFARSDHYNFVKKDIPVLFFTTGIHTTYHTPGDVIEKINFQKMELITKTMYQIGYQTANRKTRLVVDNPFSEWNKKVNSAGQAASQKE